MVPQLPFVLRDVRLGRVWMHQHRQRASPDGQPGDEGAELGGREQVHLEHGDRVGANGAVPEGVDAQLGELAPDALPELAGVAGLDGVGLEVVDVHITGGVLVGRNTTWWWFGGRGSTATALTMHLDGRCREGR